MEGWQGKIAGEWVCNIVACSYKLILQSFLPPRFQIFFFESTKKEVGLCFNPVVGIFRPDPGYHPGESDPTTGQMSCFGDVLKTMTNPSIYFCMRLLGKIVGSIWGSAPCPVSFQAPPMECLNGMQQKDTVFGSLYVIKPQQESLNWWLSAWMLEMGKWFLPLSWMVLTISRSS